MRVKLPSLTSVLEETSEAEGVDYTFPFSVLRFPFVMPLRSPVACNCDLFSASVNSKVYYLQLSTLNIQRFSASSASFA